MQSSEVIDMEGYFRQQSSEAAFTSMNEAPGHHGMMSMSPIDGMDASAMLGGDTLDDIIMQNNKEIERRRSIQQQYGVHAVGRQPSHDPRRTSMMEFGNGSHGNLNGYQFDPSPTQNGNGMVRASSMVQHHDRNPDGSRRQSTGDLSLTTQFPNMGPSYGHMGPPPTYHSPVHRQDLTMNPQDSYNNADLSAGLVNTMPIEFPTGMDQVPQSGDATPMNMYAQNDFSQNMTNSHLAQLNTNYQNQVPESQEDSGKGNHGGRNGGDGTNELDVMNKMPKLQMQDTPQSATSGRPQPNTQLSNTSPAEQRQTNLPTSSNGSTKPHADTEMSSTPVPAEAIPKQIALPGDATPSNPDSIKLPKGKTKPQNAYSSTGFDMLAVLMRVATRPNPEINIGAVDMSCAFVVCDVGAHDLPIVYCSDIFERMTGYSRHEILGQNCRFLQSPTGKVQSGVPRKYCDDDTVLFLKKRIQQRKEAQAVIINYRKGGHGFQNLLTMIPITWDTDEIKYFVGFQTDLVEKPSSIISKNPDGTYTTNYQRDYVPRYVWSEPDSRRHETVGGSGHTIGRDDVSTVLTTISNGESDLSRRIWDKVLLENTDDVVHVLSLKGLFLYLSPSSRKVLEYDSSELVGTALSSVCHPSDIVPVTRELKDTSTGASVNVVFRVRRKHSGYTWFESHGSLHTEQGKGRKCIILVGRERPVYALSRNDISATGGIGDSELWTKMSTSGMFLYVSSNSRQLLDRPPEDLVGTSIQALMRQDSKTEFGRILETVRAGKLAQFKHEMQNKRGQVLQAHSTIYPGDAGEGQKPTFLVAQTRFVRLSRSLSTSHTKLVASAAKTDTGSVGSITPNPNVAIPGAVAPQITPRTATSQASTLVNGNTTATSGTMFDAITSQAGGSGLPIGTQDMALASDLNVFDELKTTRSTSWQFELRQMEKKNRLLKEELESLQSSKRKRKRKKIGGLMQKECANCHIKSSPEWRRGPSGQRDLCNSCGLRWTKSQGRTSPRSQQSGGNASSPQQNVSPLGAGITNGSHAYPKSHPNGAHDTAMGGTATKDSQTTMTQNGTAHSYNVNSLTRPAKIEEGDEGTAVIFPTKA